MSAIEYRWWFGNTDQITLLIIMMLQKIVIKVGP